MCADENVRKGMKCLFDNKFMKAKALFQTKSNRYGISGSLLICAKIGITKLSSLNLVIRFML